MKKIICLLFSAIFIATLFASCGVNDNDKTTKADDTTEESLRTDYTFTAKYDSLELNDGLFELIAENPDSWREPLVANFGMPEALRDNLIDDAAEWLSFSLNITIDNPLDEELLIHQIKCSDNGLNDIFVDVNPGDGDAVPIEANSEGNLVYFNILVHNPDPSLDEVFEHLKNMNLEVFASVNNSANSLDITEKNMVSVKVTK